MKETKVTGIPFSQKRGSREIPAMGKPWPPYPELRTEGFLWLDGPVTLEFSPSGIESDDGGSPDPGSSIVAFPKGCSTARLGSTNSDFVRQYCASVARHMNGCSIGDKETLIPVDFKERKRVNPR